MLASLRKRYSTVRTLNTKCSLVRSMCAPSPLFVEAANGDEELLSGKKRPPFGLPPRLPENVRRCRITRAEMIACKSLSAKSALKKNRHRIRVNGRAVLGLCRRTVDSVLEDGASPDCLFVLSVMLLTGRRTCEVLNGRSVFTADGPYSLLFMGQAKKRGEVLTYRIPVLHCSSKLEAAIRRVRERCLPPAPKVGVTHNQGVSQKFQSWLRRGLLSHAHLAPATRVHALRGLYACMAYQLFVWEEDFSEAYVVMHILGHSGLQESLVYTPFHLGTDFPSQDPLGTFSLSS